MVNKWDGPCPNYSHAFHTNTVINSKAYETLVVVRESPPMTHRI